jgi:hypothetical protein
MSLTYLEEDLPEIEITEIMTGDEYINDDHENRKIGINIHSPEDIYKELILLLKSIKSIPLSRKASAFQKLHAQIIAEKQFTIPHNIVPEVSIQRRDNGDEEVFFEAYDEAHKLKRHDLRCEGSRKAFIGFETTDEDAPTFPPKLPNTVVFIGNTAKNMTTILPGDDLTGTVTQLFTKIYSNENITLVDKISLIVKISEKGFQIDPSLSLEENILKIIPEKPPVEETDTDKAFKHLEPKKHHSFVPLIPLDDCSIHGFYNVQQKIFDKLQPVLEKFKDDLIEVYYAFIDAQVNQPALSKDIPNTAYDIAVMLLDKKITIEEVTNTIKARIFIKQRDFIEEWYALIESWDVTDIRPFLSTELDIATKTLRSIQDDPQEQWMSINEEIKYIKRGEVISKDFVETIIHENPINDEGLVYDDDEMPPIYDDVLPVDISHLDEGTRELYEIVLKMFMSLQRSTGLQLDYEELTMSIPTQIRRTRDVEKITDTEFIRQLQYQWTRLLAWWICNLQQKVLTYRLQFQIWEGSATSVHLWSPYGAPMEKPQSEGMIPYILSVISELCKDDILWNKYTKITSTELNTILNTLFNDDLFKSTVLELRATFKTFEKDLPLKNLIKKGTDIKDKLTETVKDKNKANYINDYMVYLKNLPAILVTQSSNKMRSGCCLQKVTDITNEKATYFKNAYKLKQLFATERVGFEKRPRLLKSGVVIIAEAENNTLVHNTPPSKIYEDWAVEDVPEVSQIEKILDIIGKTTTIETQLKDFIFKNATTNDLLQSIIKLSQIQYLHIQTQYIEKPAEYTFLIEAFEFNDFTQTNSMDELQNTQYLRTLQHRLVLQLCFPAKPENARNNTLILLNDGLDASLLKNFIKHAVAALKEWVFNKTFNMSVNYADYIAKVREQENISKLKNIDKLSPEERKLYTDAKKLGISELYDFLEAKVNEQQTEEHYEYEDKGENDNEEADDSLNDF